MSDPSSSSENDETYGSYSSDSNSTWGEEFDVLQHVRDRTAGVQPYQYEPDASDTDSADSSSDGGTGELHRLGNTDWCSCKQCKHMPTEKESVCCQEILQTREKCREGEMDYACITDHPDFTPVCLNRAVLDTAYYQYRQQYDVDDSRKRPDEKYRHVTYRQLCRWNWKFLGRDVRRVMPACAVWKIRETFPSPTGTYQGFLM